MSQSVGKSSLRTNLSQQRETLAPAHVESLGARAQARLLALDAFRSAKMLALYSPIRNEVATDALLTAALAAGQQVCFPRVVGDGLHFCRIESAAQLSPGNFGVCEPAGQMLKIDPARIELMLIPGVAFDLRGFRLGYGRGYFDRLLAEGRFTGLRVGFCYEFQVLENLPAEGHDQKVDLLVTDKNVISPS